MKMVYICSPCRGEYEKNITKAQEYCSEALQEGLLPIAPHVYFTQFTDDTNDEERRQGLQCGLQLLRYCQLIRVYGCQVSAGMRNEIKLAGVLKIEIEVIGAPEFVDYVMAIYDASHVVSNSDAFLTHAYSKIALTAGQYADNPTSKTWKKPEINTLLVDTGEIDINKTQAAGLLRGAT